MLGPEKRARSSVAAAGLSLGEVFADFLEPLLHHAIRLRGVYDPLLFEQATAYEVPVWRCSHPDVAAYLSKAVAGCKRSIEDGKLSRVSVCFFDDERRRIDEVCVRLAAALPKVDERSAPALHSWFRESLLVLESRLSGMAPAASFQVELVCAGRMGDAREWVLVEGRTGSGGGAGEPALVEPVRSIGQIIPAEVFVKRFL